MNHSTLTVGMGREARQTQWLTWFYTGPVHASLTKCDDCGAYLSEGDWPWCKDGDPSGHRRE